MCTLPIGAFAPKNSTHNVKSGNFANKTSTLKVSTMWKVLFPSTIWTVQFTFFLFGRFNEYFPLQKNNGGLKMIYAL